VGGRAAHEKWRARRLAFRVGSTSEQTGRSERECCTTRSASQRIAAALMRLDDKLANGEPHPQSRGFDSRSTVFNKDFNPG
jgi:hypothetical protein